jgi:transposase
VALQVPTRMAPRRAGRGDQPVSGIPEGGRTTGPVGANRRLLLRAGETFSDRGTERLSQVFDLDDPTGKLQAAWNVKEQLRALLCTGSLQDARAAKARLGELVDHAAHPETNRLWRTVCRWWKEIEVLIVTGATTAKVEANNTAIKHLKRTGRGFVNSRNYTTRIMLRSAARTAA